MCFINNKFKFNKKKMCMFRFSPCEKQKSNCYSVNLLK